MKLHARASMDADPVRRPPPLELLPPVEYRPVRPSRPAFALVAFASTALFALVSRELPGVAAYALGTAWASFLGVVVVWTIR